MWKIFQLQGFDDRSAQKFLHLGKTLGSTHCIFNRTDAKTIASDRHLQSSAPSHNLPEQHFRLLCVLGVTPLLNLTYSERANSGCPNILYYKRHHSEEGLRFYYAAVCDFSLFN